MAENLRNLARAKKREIGDLVVCMLERDRHAELLRQCREAGARAILLGDGDVAGVIAAALPEGGVDIYMGSGGAPEGVLAAAALRCIGGQMQGRLMFEDDAQIERARQMGVSDPKHKYSVTEMARGNVMFAATGVTSGALAQGRAPVRARRVHAFHRDAQQVRHGPLHRGAPQFRDQDLGAGVTADSEVRLDCAASAEWARTRCTLRRA